MARSPGLETHKKRCQKRYGDQPGPLSHSQRPGSEVLLPWTLRKPPERSMLAMVTLSPGNITDPVREMEVECGWWASWGQCWPQQGSFRNQDQWACPGPRAERRPCLYSKEIKSGWNQTWRSSEIWVLKFLGWGRHVLAENNLETEGKNENSAAAQAHTVGMLCRVYRERDRTPPPPTNLAGRH